MTNFVRSFFCQEKRPNTKQQIAESISEACQALVAPKRTYTSADMKDCAGCGGYFQPNRLTTSIEVTLRFHDQAEEGVREPITTLVQYCKACLPPAPITFILEDSGGNSLDQRHYKVEDGWFQDINDETGEDQYIVSLEEYQRAFCSECSEETEIKTCKVCHPPKKTKNSK